MTERERLQRLLRLSFEFPVHSDGAYSPDGLRDLALAVHGPWARHDDDAQARRRAWVQVVAFALAFEGYWWLEGNRSP